MQPTNGISGLWASEGANLSQAVETDFSEFDAIATYFKDLTAQGGVALGIGDDAALLNTSADHQLVVATDTIVESVHFPPQATAEQIATRALCVNLSDMAAMGAKPRWFTLALTLPSAKANAQWLEGFSRGLAAVAGQYDIALIGGDTTAGPMTISLTLLAEVPSSDALQRSGAKAGDALYVTGTLGDGAAALEMINSRDSTYSERLLTRFYQPKPQVDAGIKLRTIASACIDISDGLIADLGHLCQASGVRSNIQTDLLPIHRELHQLWPQRALEWALSGGDDYQLCFAVPQPYQQTV
ncbi:thiamine-phosphate kinase, partial [Porticoccaceae bacterium]|nr:thiamine-phosphate kinase [Porticoccaceae bacterium]